jgi:hypothetical protein
VAPSLGSLPVWARATCWVQRCCARAPSLTLASDPGLLRAGDKMLDGVIPLGEALRPLGL